MPKNVNNNSNVRKLNAKWLNNSLKSIGLVSADVLNSLAPFTTPTIKSLYETGTATIKDLRAGGNVTNRVADVLSKNAIINDGKKMFSNALKDIRSGKFYNKDREDEALENSFGMNDNEDVSFGDMDEETPSVTINNYRNDTDSSEATISVMERSIEQNTKNAETLNNTMIATSSSILLQNSKIGNDILNTLDSINNNIGSILNFYQNDMKTLVESSTSFFNTMLENKDESSKDTKIKFRDVTSNGFDVGTYINYIKQNFNKVVSNHEVLSLLSDDNIRRSLVSNPIGTILPLVLTEAIPKTIKDSFSLIDNSIKESIISSFNKLGNWGNGDDSLTGELKKIFAEIFGTKTNMKSGFNTEREIDESPVKFNNLTNTTIVEVIPKYLRESTEYLRIIATAVSLNDDNSISEGILNNTGLVKSWAQNNAEIMDLSTGLFKTMKDMKEYLSESFTDFIHNNVNNRSNRLFDELNKANDANETNKKLDYEELANLYEAISGIMGTANSNINITTNEILAKLTESKNTNARGRITDKQLDLLDTVIKSGVVDNDNINYAKIGGTDIINRAIEALANNPNIRYYKDINDPRDLLRDKYGTVYEDNSPSAAEQIRQDRYRRDTFSNMFDMGRHAAREVYNKFTEGARGTVLEPIVNGIAAVGTTITDGFKEYIWDPLTIKLFGSKNDAGYREDGILSGLFNGFKDVTNGIKFFITGEEYTDSKGVLHTDEDGTGSLFGRLKVGVNKLLYGDEYADESGETVKKEGILTAFKSNFKTLSDGFFKSIHNWKIALTGSDEEANVEIGKEISKDLADRGIKVGVGTGAGGLIGSLFGGPVVGAVVGLVSSITAQSDSIRTYLFGKDAVKDEEGNIVSEETDGIISRETQRFFKENKLKMITGAVGGGVLGTVIGGPVLGAGLALAGSILNGTGIFNRFLYGDDETGREGILDSWNRISDKYFKTAGIGPNGEKDEISDKFLGMSLVSTGTGGLIGSLFGPAGIIGGSLLGFGASILAQKKNFSKWLFGDDIEIDGEKVHREGILGQFANILKVNVFEPIIDNGKYIIEDFKIFVEHDILDPIKHSFEPILNGLIKGVSNIFGFTAESITDIKNFIKEDFLGNIVEITSKVLSPITNAATFVGKTLYEFGKTVVSIPFKLLESVTKPVGKLIAGAAKAVGSTINGLIIKPFTNLVVKPLIGVAKIATKVITAPLKLIEKVSNKVLGIVEHATSFVTEIIKDATNKVTENINERIIKPIKGFILTPFKMLGGFIKDSLSLLVETGKRSVIEIKNSIIGLSGRIFGGLKKLLFGDGENKKGLLGGLVSKFPIKPGGKAFEYIKNKWRMTRPGYIDDDEWDPEEHTAAENDAHEKRKKQAYNKAWLKNRKAVNANSKLIARYTKGQLTEDTIENREKAELMAGKKIKWNATDNRFKSTAEKILHEGNKAERKTAENTEKILNWLQGKGAKTSKEINKEKDDKNKEAAKKFRDQLFSGNENVVKKAGKNFLSQFKDNLKDRMDAMNTANMAGVEGNSFKDRLGVLWGTLLDSVGDLAQNYADKNTAVYEETKENYAKYKSGNKDYFRSIRGLYNRENSVSFKRKQEQARNAAEKKILETLRKENPDYEFRKTKSGKLQYKDTKDDEATWVDVDSSIINDYMKKFGINGYAEGTDNAEGGAAVVGELGPEILNISKGSQVITNDNVKSLSESLSDMSKSTEHSANVLDRIADRFNNLVNVLVNVLGNIGSTLKGDSGNRLNNLLPNLNIPHVEEDNNETTEAAQIAEMSDGTSTNISAIGSNLFSDNDNFDGTYANIKAFNEAKEDDERNRKAQIAEIESNEKMNKLVDGEEKKETFFDKILGFGGSIVKSIVGLFTGGLGGILTTVGLGALGIAGIDDLVNNGGKKIGAVIETIVNGISGVFNWLTEHSEDILNFINTVIDVAGKIGGKIYDVILWIGHKLGWYDNEQNLGEDNVTKNMNNVTQVLGFQVKHVTDYANPFTDIYNSDRDASGEGIANASATDVRNTIMWHNVTGGGKGFVNSVKDVVNQHRVNSTPVMPFTNDVDDYLGGNNANSTPVMPFTNDADDYLDGNNANSTPTSGLENTVKSGAKNLGKKALYGAEQFGVKLGVSAVGGMVGGGLAESYAKNLAKNNGIELTDSDLKGIRNAGRVGGAIVTYKASSTKLGKKGIKFITDKINQLFKFLIDKLSKSKIGEGIRNIVENIKKKVSTIIEKCVDKIDDIAEKKFNITGGISGFIKQNGARLNIALTAARIALSTLHGGLTYQHLFGVRMVSPSLQATGEIITGILGAMDSLPGVDIIKIIAQTVDTVYEGVTGISFLRELYQDIFKFFHPDEADALDAAYEDTKKDCEKYNEKYKNVPNFNGLTIGEFIDFEFPKDIGESLFYGGMVDTNGDVLTDEAGGKAHLATDSMDTYVHDKDGNFVLDEKGHPMKIRNAQGEVQQEYLSSGGAFMTEFGRNLTGHGFTAAKYETDANGNAIVDITYDENGQAHGTYRELTPEKRKEQTKEAVKKRGEDTLEGIKIIADDVASGEWWDTYKEGWNSLVSDEKLNTIYQNTGIDIRTITGSEQAKHKKAREESAANVKKNLENTWVNDALNKFLEKEKRNSNFLNPYNEEKSMAKFWTSKEYFDAKAKHDKEIKEQEQLSNAVISTDADDINEKTDAVVNNIQNGFLNLINKPKEILENINKENKKNKESNENNNIYTYKDALRKMVDFSNKGDYESIFKMNIKPTGDDQLDFIVNTMIDISRYKYGFKAMTVSDSKNNLYNSDVATLNGGYTNLTDEYKNTGKVNSIISYASSFVKHIKNGGHGEFNCESSGGFGGETMGVYYSQKDPRWANNKYQRSDGSDDGADMSNAGCGPAAVAMTLSDMGNNVTPTDIAKDATDSGYRDYTGTNANYIQKAADDYNLSSVRISNPSSDMIKNQLNSGNPVILQGKGSDTYTKAGHYVVATGYDGDYVYINDPRGKKYSGKRDINSFIDNTYNSWSFGYGNYSNVVDINKYRNGGYGPKNFFSSNVEYNDYALESQGHDYNDDTDKVIIMDKKSTVRTSTHATSTLSGAAKINNDKPKYSIDAIYGSMKKIIETGIENYYYPVKFKNKSKYGDNIWPTQDELDHYLENLNSGNPNWDGIYNFIQSIAPIPNDGSVPRPSNINARLKASITKAKAVLDRIKNNGNVSNTTSTDDSVSSTGAVVNGLGLGWVDVVKAVKKAMADKKVGYSQTNYIKINLGREISVRTDCSGFVSACVNYYGYDNIGMLSTGVMLDDSSKLKTVAGFTKKAWPGWDGLQEGDIIVRSGHTEIFARNENGKHYVWNCGDNSTCNNPDVSTDNSSYTVVWTPGPPGPNPIANIAGNNNASDSSSSTTQGSLLSRISSGIGNIATALYNATISDDWNIDWNSVLAGDNSTGNNFTQSAWNGSVDWNSTDIPRTVYSYLRTQGLSPAAAAGILGNMYQESTVNPKLIQGNGRGPAAGIVQWENYNTKSGRWKNMSDYAKSKGKDWTDLQSQLEFMMQELGADSMNPFWKNTVNVEGKTVGPSTFAEFKNSNDVEAATYQFEKTFERAGKPRMSTRISKAKEYYDMFKDLGLSTETTGNTGGGTVNRSGGWPSYEQGHDPVYGDQWRNKIYYGNKKYSSAGCGPTSAAMAYTGLLGKNVLPDELGGKYGSSMGTESLDGFTRSARDYGLSEAEASSTNLGGTDINKIKDHLDKGHPVVISGTANGGTRFVDHPFTSEGHYVLVYGHTGDGLLINDPAGEDKEYKISGIKPSIKRFHAFASSNPATKTKVPGSGGFGSFDGFNDGSNNDSGGFGEFNPNAIGGLIGNLVLGKTNEIVSTSAARQQQAGKVTENDVSNMSSNLNNDISKANDYITSDIKKISYYNSPEYINKKKQETIDKNKREALKQLSRQMLKNRNGNIITKTKNNNETIKIEQGHSFTVGQDTYHFINTTTTNDNMEVMFEKMVELLSNISENSNTFKDIKDLKSNMNVTNTYVSNQTSGGIPNVQKTGSVNKVFSNEESAKKIAYGY